MNENIADLGGVSCALEALQKLPDADMQAFFESWATVWRTKATPEMERNLLTTDVHAPNKLRVNVILPNFEEFHDLYDAQEGDGMYRAPEDRLQIW